MAKRLLMSRCHLLLVSQRVVESIERSGPFGGNLGDRLENYAASALIDIIHEDLGMSLLLLGTGCGTNWQRPTFLCPREFMAMDR